MTLPNFLIIGAAKSGTTSMYEYLAQHPDIFMPEVKEPHFFVGWDKFVKNQAEYETLFADWSGQNAIGEASTGYLYDETSPGRIKALIPDAKIIIMLRNPVEMSFSLWKHMLRIGPRRGETHSYEKALELEPARMSDPSFHERCIDSWHGNFYYINRALYHEQVKRYIDVFGKGSVHVIIFEEFSKDPVGACAEVFKFLGVDYNFQPEIKIHNQKHIYYHSGLYKFLARPPVFLCKAEERLSPDGTLSNVRKKLAKTLIKKFRLNPELRKELTGKFQPDIDKLSALIGKDLSFWK